MDAPRCSRLTPTLRDDLDVLVRVVERQSQDFRASVLLVSDDGRHLVDAAAPGLPEDYRRAIDGLEIGPVAGSCGTAAHRGERVVVTDVSKDPLWAPYRDLAARYGIVACWSQPIVTTDGALVGTFAMYYPDPQVPTAKDIAVIRAAADRAAALLERGGVNGTDDEPDCAEA